VTRLREELGRWESFDGLMGTVSFGKDQATRRPVWVARVDKGQLNAVFRWTGETK